MRAVWIAGFLGAMLAWLSAAAAPAQTKTLNGIAGTRGRAGNQGGWMRLPPIRPPASVFQNANPGTTEMPGATNPLARPAASAYSAGAAASRSSIREAAPYRELNTTFRPSTTTPLQPTPAPTTPVQTGLAQNGPIQAAPGPPATNGAMWRRRAGSLWQRLADSVEGRPIEFAQFGRGPRNVVVVGPLAGNEVWAVTLIDRLAEHLARFPSRLGAWSVTLVRSLNPDGYVHRTATNAHGVDLNRNFNASNWRKVPQRGRWLSGRLPLSEPETRALVDVIEDVSAERVVWIRSSDEEPWLRAAAGSELLAQRAAKAHGVPLHPSEPALSGSLLAWLGERAGIDGVCLSVPQRASAEALWSAYRGVLATLLGLNATGADAELHELAASNVDARAALPGGAPHGSAVHADPRQSGTTSRNGSPQGGAAASATSGPSERREDASYAVPARPVTQTFGVGNYGTGPVLGNGTTGLKAIRPSGPTSPMPTGGTAGTLGGTASGASTAAGVPRVLSADELTDDAPLVEVVRPARRRAPRAGNAWNQPGDAPPRGDGRSNRAATPGGQATVPGGQGISGGGQGQRGSTFQNRVPLPNDGRAGAAAGSAGATRRSWLRPDIRRLPPVDPGGWPASQPTENRGGANSAGVSGRAPAATALPADVQQRLKGAGPGASGAATTSEPNVPRDRTTRPATKPRWPQPPIPLYEPPR